MALELNGVGAVYGRGTRYATRALEAVTLTLVPGELVLALGTTGSGKSTLLRIAAGVMPPSEGTVSIDGTPVAGPALEDPARRTGLVFQDPERQLFAETVLEDVSFGPRNLGLDDPEASALDSLERVGLDADSFADRSPFTLSGGEARRAAIAGVLAMRPRYLMLDEPTAGLDASGRAAVLKALRAVRREAGILLVTQDAEELLGEADRVVLLRAGRAVFQGAASSLIREPADFAAAGLEAPDVLAVQWALRERGLPLDDFDLEPAAAASSIANACGVGAAEGPDAARDGRTRLSGGTA